MYAHWCRDRSSSNLTIEEEPDPDFTNSSVTKGVTTDLDHSELKNKSCKSFELIGVMMSHCESL